MKTHRDSLKIKGVTAAGPRRGYGKGAIRYPSAEKIDFEVVEKMLKDTKSSIGPVC